MAEVVIPPSAKRRPDSCQVVVSSTDRLSSLPESLICHILTFMTTKEAVATSVLAKRWKFLWTYVPSIDLGQHDYEKDDLERHGLRFTDIVNRVLLLHNHTQRLYKFFLEVGEDIDNPLFESWMMAVVARGVRKLHVSLADFILVPHCILNCKTLVDLTLLYCVTIPADSNVRLSCLKKLDLSFVKYENDESLPNLLSGCPVLEDLDIERQVDDGMFSCVISSSTLKSLRNHFDLSDIYDHKYNHNCRLTIIAPALQFLYINDSSYYRISVGTVLSHLIQADIAHFVSDVEHGIFGCCRSVVNLVKRLHYVKFLKFRSHVQYHHEVLSLECIDLKFSVHTAKFYNLTKLEFDADWCLLRKFLQFAVNLKVLIIRKVDDELKCWREPHCVPKCMLSSLRTVCIQVEGKEVEFTMLRYILLNSKVLRRMEINDKYIDLDKELKCNVHHQIASFPRASKTCELAFVRDCLGG